MGGNFREMAVNRGTPAWLAITGSFLMMSFVYSIFSGVGRALQLSNYLEAGGSDTYVLVSPILPALMKAIGFFVAASIFCKNTGGLVFHMQYVASYITFYVANSMKLFKKWQKGTKCNMTTSVFYNDAQMIAPLTALFGLALNSVAMLIGYFLGTLLVGALVNFVNRQSFQVLAQAPGLFPGFDPNGNKGYDYDNIKDTIPRAFAVEVVCTALLGLYFTFVGLNITRRDIKANMRGKITEEKQDSQHMKSVRGGALLVFATSAIAQNVSGASFDLAHWVSSNFAVRILADTELFDGTAYDNSENYFYVYVFGNLVGWLAGAVIAYVVFGWVFRKESYDAVEGDEANALVTETMPEGNPAAAEARNRGRQTRARVNDILANSNLFEN